MLSYAKTISRHKMVSFINNLPVVCKKVTTLSLFSLALICFFAGCVTGEKMQNIRPGMSKADVINILGKPDGFRTVENHEVFLYSNRRTSGWNNDYADYNVIFENGSVIEYGAGEVRPGPRPNTVFIYRL